MKAFMAGAVVLLAFFIAGVLLSAVVLRWLHKGY